MKIGKMDLSTLATSVLVVPPLARHGDLTLNWSENRKLIKYVENGGVTIFLYGGNANLYHVPLSEYEELLEFLAETVSEDAWVIPSAGPDYGRLMDQAAILRHMPFPTTMALPQTSAVTEAGIATGLRHFAERLGYPIILYLKSDSYLSVNAIQQLVDDDVVFAIKYAVVREDPTHDPFLRQLIQRVGPRHVISGIGERPAISHLKEFELLSFTTGSGVIAPRASKALLTALQNEEYDVAESIRGQFLPLEECRGRIHPVRVLHDAVSLVGIADMGPILPFLHNLEAPHRVDVKAVAEQLLAYEQSLAASPAHS